MNSDANSETSFNAKFNTNFDDYLCFLEEYWDIFEDKCQREVVDVLDARL